MPLQPDDGTSDSVTDENFSELGKGKTYTNTLQKFGKKRANKQRIAIVLKNRKKSGMGGLKTPGMKGFPKKRG